MQHRVPCQAAEFGSRSFVTDKHRSGNGWMSAMRIIAHYWPRNLIGAEKCRGRIVGQDLWLAFIVALVGLLVKDFPIVAFDCLEKGSTSCGKR